MGILHIPATALCLTVLLAGGQVLAQSGAPPAATFPKAVSCTASLPPFGGHGSGYRAPNGSIRMRNDGGWCWLTLGGNVDGHPVLPSERLVSAPSHGTVQIGPADGALMIAYRPVTGFVGRDFFSVEISGFGDRNRVLVHVTVGR